MAEDELKEVLGRLNEGGQGGVDCRPRGLAVQLEAGAEGEQKGPGSGSVTSATRGKWEKVVNFSIFHLFIAVSAYFYFTSGSLTNF